MPNNVRKVFGGNISAIPLVVRARKRRGRKGACITIKCGCCDQKIEIYPPNDLHANPDGESLEIGGVHASLSQWREILSEILGIHNAPIRT